MNKEPKKIVNYPVNRYPCEIFVNKRWFTKSVVSQYYKFNAEPLYIGHRVYNLVFDHDEELLTQSIINNWLLSRKNLR